MADRFLLALPPEPAHVATARMFGSSVARSLGVDEESVEEIKVGISEACAISLRGGSEDPLRIEGVLEGQRLRFEVAGQAPVGIPGQGDDETPTPAALAAGLSLELIRALFEDADMERTDERTTIRFTVPVVPGA